MIGWPEKYALRFAAQKQNDEQNRRRQRRATMIAARAPCHDPVIVMRYAEEREKLNRNAKHEN